MCGASFLALPSFPYSFSLNPFAKVVHLIRIHFAAINLFISSHKNLPSFQAIGHGDFHANSWCVYGSVNRSYLQGNCPFVISSFILCCINFDSISVIDLTRKNNTIDHLISCWTCMEVVGRNKRINLRNESTVYGKTFVGFCNVTIYCDATVSFVIVLFQKQTFFKGPFFERFLRRRS